MTRRPCRESSSHAIDEIDAALDDGREVRLVLKALGRSRMLQTARRVRPVFLYDARREIGAYRHLLRRRTLGTPLFYGALADERRDRFWLLLERVEGLQLRHVGAWATWLAAAAWLGRFHRHFAARSASLASDSRLRLVRHDADHLWRWFERARLGLERTAPRSRRPRVAALGRLAGEYGRCVEILAALPPTLIHGELFASNVIVQPGPRRPRICPIDWETMATGPGLIDLAALASGSWTDAQRDELLGAYQAAWTGSDRRARGTAASLGVAFACSQMHVAIRMVGWAADEAWRPPRDHAQDWLAEAVRAARRLRR